MLGKLLHFLSVKLSLDKEPECLDSDSKAVMKTNQNGHKKWRSNG